jgi:hypothetical protein
MDDDDFFPKEEPALLPYALPRLGVVDADADADADADGSSFCRVAKP